VGIQEDPGRTAETRSPGRRLHDPPGPQGPEDTCTASKGAVALCGHCAASERDLDAIGQIVSARSSKTVRSLWWSWTSVAMS
jgi:hypothetical protein